MKVRTLCFWKYWNSCPGKLFYDRPKLIDRVQYFPHFGAKRLLCQLRIWQRCAIISYDRRSIACNRTLGPLELSQNPISLNSFNEHYLEAYLNIIQDDPKQITRSTWDYNKINIKSLELVHIYIEYFPVKKKIHT